MLEESLQLDSLLKAFKDRQIFAVQVNAGVEDGELRHFIEALNLKEEHMKRPGGTQAYLDEHEVKRIKVASAAIVGSKAAFAGMVVDPNDVYQAGLRVMDELTYQAGIETVARLGARDALPALKKIARTSLVFNKQRRELRRLARMALARLEGPPAVMDQARKAS